MAAIMCFDFHTAHALQETGIITAVLSLKAVFLPIKVNLESLIVR